VDVNGSSLNWKHGGGALNSIGLTSEPDRFIFALSEEEKLYAGEAKPNAFHHSSFLAGQPMFAAGQLKEKGSDPFSKAESRRE